MTTEDIIYPIFCYVDDQMGDVPKRPQAKLYPSERVTLGILFALKGRDWRAFYRWLNRGWDSFSVACWMKAACAGRWRCTKAGVTPCGLSQACSR